MRSTSDRLMTQGGGVLLALAALAVLVAGLTEDPRPVDAAEPAPAASSTDCPQRLVNGGFEQPVVQGYSYKSGVPGWTTDQSGIGIDRQSEKPPEGLQFAWIETYFESVLIQPFDTLPGDLVNWSLHWRQSFGKRTDSVRFGPPGTANPEVVKVMTGHKTWKKYSSEQPYEVPEGQARTELSIHGATAGHAGFIDGIELHLDCEVAFSSAASFADVDESGDTNPGDTVTFTYTATNTGTASLKNLAVANTAGPAVSCRAEGDVAVRAETVLKPTKSITCSGVHRLGQTDLSAGSVAAAATVTGDDAKAAKARADAADPTTVDPTVKASTSTKAKVPSITVAKRATVIDDDEEPPAGRVDPGDKVTYTYTVTNTGNTELATVSATVPGGGSVTCPGAPLAPRTATTCEVTVVLTQAHIDSGELAGATVTASTSQGASAKTAHSEKTTLAAVRAVAFDKAKTAPAGKVAAGDKVSYSFAVANTGNVTLTEVLVADPKAGEVTCPETSLAPGKKTTCTATYVATPADIAAGVISNTATVTAVPPDKKKVTATGSESFDPDTGKSTVERIAGRERYSTAALISQKTFAPGVDAVYIATGVNFPDALAGSAASGGDGPILLVTEDAIPSATLTELKRLKPKKIIVLGGTGVVSRAVESTLRKEGATTRQSGADRYSTAAAISAKHFQPGADVAFVATGEDFPDALTGGPAAAALGGPILLTQKAKLPSATVSELKRLKPKRIVVVGGTGVVSEAVEKALASYTSGKVSRLAGADRYSTGGAISKDAFKPGVPVAYVATGANFPDALAGGAAGAFRDGPVLLVAGATIPKATAAELTRLKPKSIIVLGGTAVVPEKVETALAAYLPKTP